MEKIDWISENFEFEKSESQERKRRNDMKKYIFLDMDGVIATPNHSGRMWSIDKSCEKRLGEILDRTGALIVLSSSWRKETVEDTVKKMQEHNFKYCDKIVGVTIRAYDHIKKGVHLSIPRGVEIKQWLDTNVHSNNGKDWDRKLKERDFNYVILDDDMDMLLEHKDNFVRTQSIIGITDKDVDRAVSILNNYC